MKAVVCPICNGEGKTHRPTPKLPGNVEAETISESCYGCGGLGWVQVPEDNSLPSLKA